MNNVGKDMFGTTLRIKDQVIFYSQQPKGRGNAVEFYLGKVESFTEHFIFIRYQDRIVRRKSSHIIKYKCEKNKEE